MKVLGGRSRWRRGLLVCGCWALLGLIWPRAGLALEFGVSNDRPSCVYTAGETIKWRVELKRIAGTEKPPATINYTIKRDGLTVVGSGKLALTENAASLEYKAETPSAVLVAFSTPGADGKDIVGLGGAIVSPEKIKPSASRPEDFDAFWEKQIGEIRKIAPNAKLTAGESKKAGVSYWKVTLDNVRGTHIQGQLARPEKGEKFPAMLVVQWAGVYPLAKEWATDWAGRGWLTLNIEAHDIPIDENKEYYANLVKNELSDYAAIGNDDREKTYFNRMYLSCYQAAEYLATRPDWNGEVLVVTGGSQGGLQSLVTAGLHPKITGAVASVPAGCDMTGMAAGREPGWPKWAMKTAGKDKAKVLEASRYYDVVNFASRIRCPVLIGAGIVDTTCPPAGILAAYNEIPSAKEIVLMPGAGHKAENNSHGPYYGRAGVWFEQLKTGKSPTVKGISK